MINKQTTLELNGPNIAFIQQPQSVTIDRLGSAQFVGISTATFPVQDPPNPATGTGLLAYQWYEKSFGELSDGSNTTLGATISGSGTTTLSLTSATINNLEFYVIADYVPSAYSQPPGAVVTVGTARSTGNATNEPATSNTATLTVRPIISVTQNPSSVDIGEGLFANFSVGGSSNDGTPVFYRWQLNDNDVSDSGTVSGSGTPNLRIALPTASNNTVRARISHPTASNSPLFTNRANFNVFIPRAVLNYEYTQDATTSRLGSGSFDLKDGRATFSYLSSLVERVPVHPNFGIITIYPPERDVNVRITLAAAAGGPGFIIVNNALVTVPGGQGGITIFDLTLKKNVEYVIRTGIRMGLGNSPQGGFPNGGGGSYFYRQAQTLVISGGGGGSTNFTGRGGSGGGALNSGGSGSGLLTTAGGAYVSPGTLGISGSFSRDATLAFNSTSGGGLNFNTSRNFGGKASSCPPGGSPTFSYWIQQGFSQCSNVGFVRAREASGNEISNTTNTIERGHKYGLGFRNNGGNGYAFQNDNRRTGGGGGDGAYGGNGGATHSTTFDGGGGGSGYTNGEATIISSTLGGNPLEYGYARIELR
jgi:hypothetical protein